MEFAMNKVLFTQEEIEFINSTDVSGSEYIDKYRILAKHFSLIPVHYNPDNKDKPKARRIQVAKLLYN